MQTNLEDDLEMLKKRIDAMKEVGDRLAASEYPNDRDFAEALRKISLPLYDYLIRACSESYDKTINSMIPLAIYVFGKTLGEFTHLMMAPEDVEDDVIRPSVSWFELGMKFEDRE